LILLAFGLLAAVFRSIAIPVKAAAMNLLSMGAAYGVIVAVYQWGWLAGIFGGEPRRADRPVDSADDVHHRVRPVDGLRNLPPVADARGVGPDRTGDNSKLPYLLNDWHFHRPLPYWAVAQAAGALLICAGLVPIGWSFAEFTRGDGTPVPAAPQHAEGRRQAEGQANTARINGVPPARAGLSVKIVYHFTRRSIAQLTGREAERMIEPANCSTGFASISTTDRS
jgi:hypothetical protein